MKEKKWFFRTIVYLMTCLILAILLVIIVDPYFHFHAPIEGMSYRLYEERYINDGIARNFEYDAIITGTSMTQNFKVSKFNELFDGNAIKIPFSGAGYQEISQNLQRAFGYHEDINCVLWCLDGTLLIEKADYQSYDGYPDYLYDNNVFNDVSYVLNKEILYHGVLKNIVMTLAGEPSTSFDEYSAWDNELGSEAVFERYERKEEVIADSGLNNKESVRVEENIRINICEVIEAHPDTTFYIFFPPYSIVYWDNLYREGRISAQIEAETIAAELLLQYPNVELYCFYENMDLIADLDNYKDTIHYSAEINSQILEWINGGEYRITTENLKEHEAHKKELYLNFDYDSLFE